MLTNSYDTGRLGGNREDVRGTLTILEPEATPFLTLINKVSKAKSTFVEVGVDEFEKPNRTGSREGDPAKRGGNKAKSRARIGSFCHRWTEEFGVTDVQQLITKKGGNAFTSDEYADAEAKGYIQIKRRMEATLLSSQEHQGGSEEDMRLRGFFTWTGGAVTTDSTIPGYIPAFAQTPAGMRLTGQASLVDVGANSLMAWLKAARSATGRTQRYVGLAGLDYLEDIEQTFTGVDASVSSRKFLSTDMGEGHEIDMTVRGFKTSMGNVDFMGSDFLLMNEDGTPSATTPLAIALFDPELWFIDQLFPLAPDEENEDGGGKDGRLKCIATLMTKSPKGSGFIRN